MTHVDGGIPSVPAMNFPCLVSCLGLAAASLSAQSQLLLPSSANPTMELGNYSQLPLMQPNARVQMFYDATEVGSSSFTADELSFRYDGPIPQVGAPGPFTIQNLRIDVGVTTIPMPGAEFAANLTQPLTTVFNGPWSYMPDPGMTFPHAWGAPSGSLTFAFTTPVAVTIPVGGWLVIDVTMEGNDIASFGFSHALLDGANTSGGIGNGSATLFGQGCNAGQGPAAATIASTGLYAPGAAHFLSGQNLGASAIAVTVFGLVDPNATLPGTNCTINVDPIVMKVVVTDANGAFGPTQSGAALAIPVDGSFAGLTIFEQAVSLVPSANPWGLVSSNAAAVTLGIMAPLGRGFYSVAHDNSAVSEFANVVRPFGYAARLHTL